MRKVWDQASDITDLSNNKLWSAYLQVNESLQYLDNNTNNVINPTLWLPGKYNSQPCVVHTREGYMDKMCNEEYPFMCHQNSKNYLHLRGLCQKSLLENSYMPSVHNNYFSWIGAFGTVIKYSNSRKLWEARVQGSEVWATSEASYESLLLGFHEWTIHGDRQCLRQSSYKANLSLTVCTTDQFNCNDGSCIPLIYWCDNNALNNSVTCEDGSDELNNCSVIHDLSGYQKHVIPVPNPYTEINFVVEILSIQDILPFEGKIKINFNLSMEWPEPRVEFLGLWENKIYNKIKVGEQEKLWKPSIVFSNILLTGSELPTRPVWVADCKDYDNYSKTNTSSLYNNNIFKKCFIFFTTIMRYYPICNSRN
jgi:hypothetical protein